MIARESNRDAVVVEVLSADATHAQHHSLRVAAILEQQLEIRKLERGEVLRDALRRHAKGLEGQVEGASLGAK